MPTVKVPEMEENQVDALAVETAYQLNTSASFITLFGSPPDSEEVKLAYRAAPESLPSANALRLVAPSIKRAVYIATFFVANHLKSKDPDAAKEANALLKDIEKNVADFGGLTSL